MEGKHQSPSVYRWSTNLPDFTFVHETNFRMRDQNLNLKIALLLKTFVFLHRFLPYGAKKLTGTFHWTGAITNQGHPAVSSVVTPFKMALIVCMAAADSFPSKSLVSSVSYN